MLTGGDILKEFFDHYKTDYIFGNPGTTETTFLEAISHCKDTKYILALQESSAIGIAAGYAMATRKPSIVNIHTYPGLANSMCNMYNAFVSGIPLLVIAGQQDRRFLIHNPVLSGKLTTLAATATKYQYEVTRADDLGIALQRCYTQAEISPTGPTFLSIPLDILDEESDTTYFKDTKIIQDSCSNNLSSLVGIIQKTPKGKLAFIADYESGATDCDAVLSVLSEHLEADIYAAPYHVRTVVDPCHKNFKGHLPAMSGDAHKVLSQYQMVILLGEKIDSFFFTGKATVPKELTLVQISASGDQLSFDYPCDLAIMGDINATLEALKKELGSPSKMIAKQDTQSSQDLEGSYGEQSDTAVSLKMVYKILAALDRDLAIVTEGSSEDNSIQEMALQLKFNQVHFSPRGGGLGWAMPISTGLSLASQKHTICFAGDGGSLFAIHSIWTAAKYKIPVIYVCFINHQYKILKNLWCMQKKTKFDETNFIGLDFNDPEVDLEKIASGFGARTVRLTDIGKVNDAISTALAYQGPSFLMIEC
ncbi:MAG: thiamine pyrophosphate-binding protein [Coxiellaceae bacterium]|nr:thiamine pyrophosphate-binding protein [Coxiellaceae bacterium]